MWLPQFHFLLVQNAALQNQIHSLFEEVTTAKKDKLKLTEQLSALRQSLEAGKEEEHMMKGTLSEKNAQLLHSEDQLLWVGCMISCSL